MSEDNEVRCAVRSCVHPPVVEVLLYDIYLTNEQDLVFAERDYTCPYLCACHLAENEYGARGKRLPRVPVRYPHSNRYGAQGYTIYRNLDGAVSGSNCSDRAVELLVEWQRREGGYDSGGPVDLFQDEKAIRDVFEHHNVEINE